MITLSLLCFTQFILISYCLYINRKVNIILIFFFGLLFYIPLPAIVSFIYHQMFQLHFPKYEYSEDKIFEILFISNIYLFFFSLGFTIAQFISAKENKKTYQINDGVLLILIIIFFSLTFLERYFIQLIPYIKNGILFFIFSLIYLHKQLLSLNLKNKKIYFYLILLLLIIIFVIFFSSSRRDILNIFVISLIFIFINRKDYVSGVSYLNLVIFIPIIIIMAYVCLSFIIFKRSGHLYQEIDFFSFEFFSYFYDYLKRTPFLFSIFAYADYLIGFENFKYIVQKDQILNGSSFFKFLFSPIPRDIWPEKPYDVQHLIVQLYKNPFVGGTSQTVPFFGEIYWNFKIILGSFVIFIFGVVFNRIEKLFNLNSDIHLINYLFISFSFFEIWRGGFSTQFIYLLINLTFINFLIYLFKFKKIKL